jgi:hypothetical protein
MKRVAKVASPAAIAVLRQATALFPKRKKTKQTGCCLRPAHLKGEPEFGPQYWASGRLDP